MASSAGELLKLAAARIIIKESAATMPTFNMPSFGAMPQGGGMGAGMAQGIAGSAPAGRPNTPAPPPPTPAPPPQPSSGMPQNPALEKAMQQAQWQQKQQQNIAYAQASAKAQQQAALMAQEKAKHVQMKSTADAIKKGVPGFENQAKNMPEAPQAGGQKSNWYTVQPGDTMSGIAQNQLGNGNLYSRLQALKGNNIQDPNMIMPGQRIRTS
jgi:LysM repeat protein